MDEKNSSLGQRTIFGIIWNFISQFSRQLLTIAFNILLIRLLQPADYGLFALLFLFISLSTLIAELGLKAVIIQEKDIDNQALSSIFWLCLTNGLVLIILINALLPTLEIFFQTPGFHAAGILFSIIIPLEALLIVPKALLEKKLQFKVLARVEITAVLLSGLLGISLAMLNCGVYSLIIQYIFKTVLLLLLFWKACNWLPSFTFHIKKIAHLLPIGLSLCSNYLLAYLADNLDDFLIGKRWGQVSLGLYNRAFMLTSLPVRNLSETINRVLLATYSNLRQKKQVLQRLFLKLNAIVFMIIAPIMIILYFLAPIFVDLLFGQQWQNMIPLFQVFCFTGILASINALLGPLIVVQGQSRIIFQDGLAQKSVIILSILIGIQGGVLMLVWFRLLAEVINIGITFYNAKRSVGLSIYEQLQNLWPIFALNLSLFLLWIFMNQYIPAASRVSVLYALIFLSLYILTIKLFKFSAFTNLIQIVKTRNLLNE